MNHGCSDTADKNLISSQSFHADLLYIVVGGVVGVLLVGICFVSILLILVCLKRRRRKSEQQFWHRDISDDCVILCATPFHSD